LFASFKLVLVDTTTALQTAAVNFHDSRALVQKGLSKSTELAKTVCIYLGPIEILSKDLVEPDYQHLSQFIDKPDPRGKKNRLDLTLSSADNYQLVSRMCCTNGDTYSH
jgi:hypothetical protein